MEQKILQDKCRGSLIGGAVGDALGYEVEILALVNIRNRFGENGITDYVLHDGCAVFSDDTQMSLFTAEGLLSAIAKGNDNENYIQSSLRRGYEHWSATQIRNPYSMDASWLTNIRALWSERAPGMTCMEAMHQISFGDGSPVENNSKGAEVLCELHPLASFQLRILKFSTLNARGISQVMLPKLPTSIR